MSSSMDHPKMSSAGFPLFSIIMPVYNKKPYIKDTIASVHAQTCTSFEVVMIGGASTDETDAICCGFASTDPGKHGV